VNLSVCFSFCIFVTLPTCLFLCPTTCAITEVNALILPSSAPLSLSSLSIHLSFLLSPLPSSPISPPLLSSPPGCSDRLHSSQETRGLRHHEDGRLGGQNTRQRNGLRDRGMTIRCCFKTIRCCIENFDAVYGDRILYKWVIRLCARIRREPYPLFEFSTRMVRCALCPS
jgi:hypothetical protein